MVAVERPMRGLEANPARTACRGPLEPKKVTSRPGVEHTQREENVRVGSIRVSMQMVAAMGPVIFGPAH